MALKRPKQSKTVAPYQAKEMLDLTPLSRRRPTNLGTQCGKLAVRLGIPGARIIDLRRKRGPSRSGLG